MIIIIDNYDSFTYNLVQRLGEIDSALDIQVFRNDQITVDEIFERKPERVIISPGPCTPTEAGISVECCQRLKGRLPLLGVCLGHQSMGQAFGAHDRPRQESHARQDRHDPPRRPTLVRRSRQSVSGDALPQPRDSARHAVQGIRVTAWAEEPGGYREIMGIAHREFPLFGVQFHPESFLTHSGYDILRSFLAA